MLVSEAYRQGYQSTRGSYDRVREEMTRLLEMKQRRDDYLRERDRQEAMIGLNDVMQRVSSPQYWIGRTPEQIGSDLAEANDYRVRQGLKPLERLIHPGETGLPAMMLRHQALVNKMHLSPDQLEQTLDALQFEAEATFGADYLAEKAVGFHNLSTVTGIGAGAETAPPMTDKEARLKAHEQPAPQVGAPTAGVPPEKAAMVAAKTGQPMPTAPMGLAATPRFYKDLLRGYNQAIDPTVAATEFDRTLKLLPQLAQNEKEGLTLKGTTGAGITRAKELAKAAGIPFGDADAALVIGGVKPELDRLNARRDDLAFGILSAARMGNGVVDPGSVRELIRTENDLAVSRGEPALTPEQWAQREQEINAAASLAGEKPVTDYQQEQINLALQRIEQGQQGIALREQALGIRQAMDAANQALAQGRLDIAKGQLDLAAERLKLAQENQAQGPQAKMPTAERLGTIRKSIADYYGLFNFGGKGRDMSRPQKQAERIRIEGMVRELIAAGQPFPSKQKLTGGPEQPELFRDVPDDVLSRYFTDTGRAPKGGTAGKGVRKFSKAQMDAWAKVGRKPGEPLSGIAAELGVK